MGAERGERRLDELSGTRADDDLAAVGRAHDASCEVDIHAHVLGRIEAGRAGVDADPDPDWAFFQARHRFRDRRNCLRCRGEGVEEGVPLVVDLVPREVCIGLTHDPAVLCEGLAVGVHTELFEQPGRALDVTEDERYLACGLRDASHEVILCRGADRCNVGCPNDSEDNVTAG